jgi:hypothetical protein
MELRHLNTALRLLTDRTARVKTQDPVPTPVILTLRHPQ